MNRVADNDQVRHILIVEHEVVPNWWLHLIDHFIAAILEKGELPVVYVQDEQRKKHLSIKKVLILVINLIPLLAEWGLFGLQLSAFQKKNVQSHLKKKKVEVYSIHHLSEVEKTDVFYILSNIGTPEQYSNQNVVFLNQGLGEIGFHGCMEFIFHFMIQRKPFQIGVISEKGKHVVYEHFFQTFNHNLVQNINYWLWALSIGVKKICTIALTTVDSDVFYPGEESFFLWGKSIKNRLLWKGLPKILSPFYIKKWGVVLQKKTSENQCFQPEQSYQIAFPDLKNGWADPFLIQHEGQHYLFLEELNEEQQKGILVVAQLDQNGMFRRIEPILSESFHLSYPFVFEKEGQWYLIPESAQGRNIRLYQANQFPFKWQYVKDLMADVQAYDTTSFYYNDKWWMFSVIKKGDGASSFDQLYLFYARDIIEDEWLPHPLNPIVTDSRVARPAGKVFIQDGKLYRPSQDCFERYGHKLVINEITHLSEAQYEERVSEEITLNSRSDVSGIHTYNFNEDLLVVDALFRKASFSKSKEYKDHMVKAKLQD
ncbi:MAG: hypothetical protein JEZ14_06935 [Marinilabiliaceae bacterium]|nr:hypothetical protein [Marinilabiliaceae bacterium]